MMMMDEDDEDDHDDDHDHDDDGDDKEDTLKLQEYQTIKTFHLD